MTDYVWPDDLVPYAVSFYLQPHTGGSESPFSRTTKVYGLSAPRWICKLRLRAPDSADRWDGAYAEWGERVDALLDKLRGRENRVWLWDFRREGRLQEIGNGAAAAGSNTITITNAYPDKIRVGEYIGGVLRPHRITRLQNFAPHLTATVEPPFQAAVGIDEGYFVRVGGLFRLTSDDAADNSSSVGELTEYQLEFVEDWANPLVSTTPVVYNISDGASPTYSVEATGSAIQISNTIFNKDLLFSTGIEADGPRTRIIATIRPTTMAGTLRVGLGFRDLSGNYVALGWQNNGWLVSHSNYAGVATGAISTTLPTYAAGDVLRMQFDLTDTGEIYVTVTKNNGQRMCVGITGVPVGDAYLHFFDDTTAAVATFTLEQRAVDAVSAPSMQTTVPTSYVERAQPSGFTASRLPSWVKFYWQPSTRLFGTNLGLSPILREDDNTVFVQYVDVSLGSDTTGRGTSAYPLKSIHKAIDNAVKCRTIIKARGTVYDFNNSWRNADPTATVLQLVSWDGNPVTSSMHDAGLTWALDTGSTYSATFTLVVVNVFDALNLTSDGDYTKLGLAASLALCRSTAGTYFVSGTTIYVHAIDGRAPDANIRVYKKASDTSRDYNGHWEGTGTMYLENVRFEGGQQAFWTNTPGGIGQQVIYGRDCTFKYSGSGSAPIVNGDVLAVWQRCTAAWNSVDGFHYNHIFSSTPATGIELDCIGRWNGTDGSGANNNSSNHSGPTIRVATQTGKGVYHHAENRGIHDIKDTSISQSSLSWHLGITVRDSRNGYSNLGCGSGTGAPKMWNDTVTSSGATNDQEAQVGATIYDFDLVRSATDTGTGTITTYTP